MHFPEFSLQPGSFGRLCGQQGFIMDGQRERTIDHAHLVGKISHELRQHGRKLGAVWSLKVAIFDDRYRGIFRPFDPVIIIDRCEKRGLGRAGGGHQAAGYGAVSLSGWFCADLGGSDRGGWGWRRRAAGCRQEDGQQG